MRLGREDRSLTTRLLKECPAILLWAIAGYERLCERGYFLQPDSAQDAIQELEDLGSPILAFLRERCEISSEAVCVASELYDAYKSWCGDQGRGIVATVQTFGRDLRAALPSLRVVQLREYDRQRCYLGVKMRRF